MVAAVFLALCAPAFAGTLINLSPEGDDATADGSAQKPFASLKAAMEFAEKSGGGGKIAFKFADGTYEFPETAVFEAGASGNRKVLIEGSGNTVFCGVNTKVSGF